MTVYVMDITENKSSGKPQDRYFQINRNLEGHKRIQRLNLIIKKLLTFSVIILQM